MCSALVGSALTPCDFSHMPEIFREASQAHASCCTVLPPNPVNLAVERPLPLRRPLTHERACKLPVTWRALWRNRVRTSDVRSSRAS